MIGGLWNGRVQDLLQCVDLAVRLEQASSRAHLPEDDAERKLIAAPVERLPADLLGGHVLQLALDHARLRAPVRGLRDAEVDQLHAPFAAHHDVLRAHVAVDDVERVPGRLRFVRVVEAERSLVHTRALTWKAGRRPLCRSVPELREVFAGTYSIAM